MRWMGAIAVCLAAAGALSAQTGSTSEARAKAALALAQQPTQPVKPPAPPPAPAIPELLPTYASIYADVVRGSRPVVIYVNCTSSDLYSKAVNCTADEVGELSTPRIIVSVPNGYGSLSRKAVLPAGATARQIADALTPPSYQSVEPIYAPIQAPMPALPVFGPSGFGGGGRRSGGC